MLHVVVVGSCARRRRLAVFRCWRGPGDRTRQDPGTKHEGHTGTSDSSILHQNNVNQTSAFGPWLLLLRRGLAQLQILFLTDSQDCTQRHALLNGQLLFKIAVAAFACSSDANWYSRFTVCQNTG